MDLSLDESVIKTFEGETVRMGPLTEDADLVGFELDTLSPLHLYQQPHFLIPSVTGNPCLSVLQPATLV